MDNSKITPQSTPKWLILTLVCMGTFMSTLDISIVTVAMPTLRSVFHTTVAVSQWFVLSYNFVITILLLTFGKLGDMIGRRRLYSYGILVFVTGSAACGLSISAAMLILARAAQGIGSAVTMSAGPALVSEAFPEGERGRALGFIGMVVAAGLLAGPLIGGAIVQYLSWHWMFFLNVPAGLVLSVLLSTRVQGFNTNQNGRLDILGAALMAVSISSALMGLTYGHDFGWGSALTLSIFGLAVISAILFLKTEARVKNPVLDLRLFKNRGFKIGAISGWASYASTIPVLVFMPFYIEDILHYQPDKMGMILASGPLTLAFIAPIAGHLSDRIGSRALTSLGLAIAGVGLFSMQWLTPACNWFDVAWRLVLMNLGSAMFVPPNSSFIMSSVKVEDYGVASGTIALVRNLGMVSGIALAGAIITSAEQHAISGELLIQHLAFISGLKSALLFGMVLSFGAAAVSAMRVHPVKKEVVS